MERTRKRISEKTRELRGTLRKDRTTPSPEILEGILIENLPPIPRKFRHVKKYYEAAGNFALEKKLLTPANQNFILAYAIEVSKYFDILEKMAEEQPGTPSYKALNAVKNSALENAVKLAGLFGIDPASALKFGTKEPPPEANGFEEFI
jgi:hypothetical protein